MKRQFTMSDEEIRKQQIKVHGYYKDNSARSGTDVEQRSVNLAQEQNETKETLPPVVIRFTHYRRKLADVDNFATKWFIDALVKDGLLRDDSPKEVTEVRHRQIKIEQWDDERTEIELIANAM